MKLYRMFGIVHHDPSCRLGLGSELKSLVKKFGPPSVVAVEAERTVYEEIKARRPEFKSMLKTAMTGRPAQREPQDELLDACADTLWYEAEVAMDATGFGPSDVLWLENGRGGHAGQRMAERLRWSLDAIISPQSFTPDAPWDVDISNAAAAITRLKQGTHEASNAANPNSFKRDEVWFHLLEARSAANEEGWAAVVCGALHATYFEGEPTLRTLLESDKRSCEAIFPCFVPPAKWGY